MVTVGATGRSEAGRRINLAICHADRAGQYGRGQALQERLLSFAFFNFSLIYEKFWKKGSIEGMKRHFYLFVLVNGKNPW